jgi:6-phosphogluconolactonase
LVVVSDSASLAREAATRFSSVADESVARESRFDVAIAGGSTPKALYTLLATPPYRDRLPWRHTHVFWGDERCVPPEHAESNYRMAADTLLRYVPVPPEQIHRIRGEDPEPDRAAAEYERALRATLDSEAEALPRFDLILLGMGSDGHTASLFPGSPALAETKRLVLAPYVETLKSHRLTLTLPVLNAARYVMILVSGEEKARTLRAVFAGGEAGERLPVQLIRPLKGTLSWLVDAAAARLLKT